MEALAARVMQHHWQSSSRGTLAWCNVWLWLIGALVLLALALYPSYA